MDIKPPVNQIHIYDLTKCQRSYKIPQFIAVSSSPVFADDIIDCIEIETVKRSPANKKIFNYKSLSNHLVTKKGVFIDILI